MLYIFHLWSNSKTLVGVYCICVLVYSVYNLHLVNMLYIVWVFCSATVLKLSICGCHSDWLCALLEFTDFYVDSSIFTACTSTLWLNLLRSKLQMLFVPRGCLSITASHIHIGHQLTASAVWGHASLLTHCGLFMSAGSCTQQVCKELCSSFLVWLVDVIVYNHNFFL